MKTVSVGIMAYNEEANIGRLLAAIQSQDLRCAAIQEIIVVVSGSTDGTEAAVRERMKQDNRIKLYIQPFREGKASAVNLFLSKAAADICILESADTVPAADAFDKLLLPFNDQSVGMSGCRPVPVNQIDTFMGFAAHFMWYLHHKIALVEPKLGEMVAFRNCVREIPVDTAVDEASIEAVVRRQGFRLCYVPDAICYNKGPETVKDFIRQRRRIAAGHHLLSRSQAYEVSTSDPLRIVQILLREKPGKMKHVLWGCGVILLEAVGRVLGSYDVYIGKKKHHIWDMAPTTKKLT
jgi:biofilm PGA synthesis N-glycosyltransferase PgaC